VLPHGPVLATVGATASAIAMNLIPELASVRRLLRNGFTLANMRDALRLHIEQRREEIALDPIFTPIRARTLKIAAFGGLGSAAAGALLLISGIAPRGAAGVLIQFLVALGATVGAASAIGAAIAKPASSVIRKFGQSRLDFWNGKWGDRLVRLASLGLKRGALAPPASPQHTEVALGHATHALFEALPKNVRRDLKAVPATVARLESDAGALRTSLDALDDLLSGGDNPDLVQRRELAAERLASTVTALENIRLGLLRLQLGSAPVAQVTEALDAASRIGREIDLALNADDEIGDFLKPKRIANHDPEPSPV
jgi:hypothetical protein